MGVSPGCRALKTSRSLSSCSICVQRSLARLPEASQFVFVEQECPKPKFRFENCVALNEKRPPFQKKGWPLRESPDSVCPPLGWVAAVLEQQDRVNAERGLAVAVF